MDTSLKHVAQLAHALTISTPARLPEALLESLQIPPLSDVEALWDREIEARVAAYDCGETQSYAAEDVFAEARRQSR